MYTPGSISDSHRRSAKIDKVGAIATLRNLVELAILEDIQTFRTISNEMSISVLILC